MTKEQSDSLNRVRASLAYSNDQDLEAMTYHTADIHNVLFILKNQEDVLRCTKEDLVMLRAYTEEGADKTDVVGMLDSTLSLLESEK